MEDVESSLTWRTDREAVEHQVYLATVDKRALVEGSDPAARVATLPVEGPYASYTASDLMLAQTYVWRVVEIIRTARPIDSSPRGSTAHGIESFSLSFHGAPANSGQLYVTIDDARVPYTGSITEAEWQDWSFDLATVATNLASVTKLTIGIEGAGATGVVYIDDIRLYSASK